MCQFNEHLTELVDCCSVSVSSKVKVYLPRIFEDQVEDLVYRLVCREKNNGVLCTVYYSTLPPRDKLVLTKDDIVKTILDVNRKICPGVPESVARTEVDKRYIFIQKVGDEFIYRSRKCGSTLPSNKQKRCNFCKDILDSVKSKSNVGNINLLDCPDTACVERFPSSSAVARHIQSAHVALLKCSWDNCDQQFATQRSLDNHVKRHLKEFSHFCDDCDKGFVTNSELKLHRIFHQEEKEFACNVCGKTFARRVNLATHMTVHTGNIYKS